MEHKDCEICIFPHLRGCPVGGSYHNAACLNMFKDINTCKDTDCDTCKWLKYCKEVNFIEYINYILKKRRSI